MFQTTAISDRPKAKPISKKDGKNSRKSPFQAAMQQQMQQQQQAQQDQQQLHSQQLQFHTSHPYPTTQVYMNEVILILCKYVACQIIK